MRLLLIIGAGFAIAFGVGWLCHFSYQTDWIAGLILSTGFYLSLQVDELYMLVLQSVPGARAHSKLPKWIKRRFESEEHGA
jgi:hypothetical protein